MQKSGLLITGGEAPGRRWFELVKDRFDIVVAADSGLLTAMNMEIKADYIVGDMDSIGDKRVLESFPDESIFTYERDKDYTDTEIGLSLLQRKGCVHRCIIGGGAGRLDHLIGILSLFDKTDAPDMWITNSAVVVMIRDIFRLKGMKGRTISFFPAGCEKSTMKSEGLKWPLDALGWKKGDLGVSNIVTSDEVEVTMRTGRLIFVGELETLRGLPG